MQRSSKKKIVLVRRSPMGPSLGILQCGKLRLRCALGRNSTTILKREGDGATPVASMRCIKAYRRPSRFVGFRPSLPAQRTRADSGWCDSPSSSCYNRPVRLPFRASAETLQRNDRLYDFVVVLDWNVSRRQRGRGSAIFLHVAHPDYRPTEGCIAVSPTDMRRLEPFIRLGMRLVVSR